MEILIGQNSLLSDSHEERPDCIPTMNDEASLSRRG
jgi:hypothetical protein